MGLLAYVGGVLTSFGGTTTQVATTDTATQDLLEQLLVEQRVTNVLLALGLELDVDLEETRHDVAES